MFFKLLLVAMSLNLVSLNVSAAPSDNALGKTQFGLCVRCHGKNGEGKKNLQAPAIAGLPDWYILNQLKTFKKGDRGTHPDDTAGMRMRAMSRVVKKEDRMIAVSKYISELTPVTPARTITKGDAEKGKTKFTTCIACHGAAGMGMKVLNSPPLVHSQDWYLFTQLKNLKSKARVAVTMNPMAMGLSEDDMLDLLAYINTLQPKK